MTVARLHDGSTIDVEVYGEGATVLLPVNPHPVTGPEADVMRQWGADPALGRSLIDGLSDTFRVVAFDYEGHVLAAPKPDTLTPANVAGDLLAVADAAGALRFAYYGYSWLASMGLQLAIRTERVVALTMGGFPPIDGPYAQMLRVTTVTHEMAIGVASSAEPATPGPEGSDSSSGDSLSSDSLSGDSSSWEEKASSSKRTDSASEGDAVTGESSDASSEGPDWESAELTLTEAQTRQFVTLYQALQGFDDRAQQTELTCPRLCFVGSADTIDYGERWGGVRVSMADPIVNHRAELEAFGWDVRVLDGLDHLGAMQAAQVVPILRPWLESVVGGARRSP